MPVITQDGSEQEDQPAQSPDPNQRSNRLNKYISLRIAGIVAILINQFTGSVFLEEMRRTVTVKGTLFKPAEIANGVVHPVAKETIP